MEYIYAKDKEGFVVKKQRSELLPDEIIISKSEYDEISGENYYNETFHHGGKRKGAGRKPKDESKVLKFQVRVSEKEKEFLKYAREHKINYDNLMQI